MRITEKLRKLIEKSKTSDLSLSGKTARGTGWLFALRNADRLFKIIKVIVLARILSPEDFGVFGAALLVMDIISNLSRTGYSQALIQKKEDVRPYLDTAWTVMIIRAVLISAAIFFLSGPASLLFGVPEAGIILKVIGFSLIIKSFGNIAAIYFQKDLEFHKFFKYQFIGTCVDFLTAISAAFVLRSVWALVLGLLAGSLVRSVMSYVIEPYRPRFRLEKMQAKELFAFGKWISGSSLLIFFITQGDDILVGSLLGAAMLGFYQMAYRISNTPTADTVSVISQISLPLFSKIQDDPEKLKRTYLKILQIVSFLSFPAAAFLIVLAPGFTKLFLGEQWMPMVPAMRVIAFSGSVSSVINTSTPLFRAVGKPGVETRWQAARLLMILILIYPLTIRYGILGTALAVAISAFLSSIGFFVKTIAIIKCRAIELLKHLFIPVAGSAAAASILYMLGHFIDGEGLPGFFLLLFAAAALFSGMVYLSHRFLGYSILQLFRQGLKSFIDGT